MGDQECIFFTLTHTKQLLLVTYCDTTAETDVSVQKHGQTDGTNERKDGQTDVEVEIVI